MHHLVVGEREDEVLGERVEQPEAELVVVVDAVDRVAREIVECVVHPAEVPLEPEAEAADRDGSGDSRPCRRFLRHEDRPGLARVGDGVESADELDRLVVLVAAVGVRDPGSGRTRVVAVEHRCDRVDTQPVCVVLAQPEERIGARKFATSGRPKLKTSVPSRDAHPGAGPRARRARCRRSGQVRTRRGENGAGTQSQITPTPAACSRSTKLRKSSGDPSREVGRSSRSPGSPTNPRRDAP